MVRRAPSVQSGDVHCTALALENRVMWCSTDILLASPEEWIYLRINQQLDKIASWAHTEEVTVWWSLYFDYLNDFEKSLKRGNIIWGLMSARKCSDKTTIILTEVFSIHVCKAGLE